MNCICLTATNPRARRGGPNDAVAHAPPLEGTDENDGIGMGKPSETSIVVSPHVPSGLKPNGRSQIVREPPRSRSTAFNAVRGKNAIDCPSGDQNGLPIASSVLDTIVGCTRSSERSQTALFSP